MKLNSEQEKAVYCDIEKNVKVVAGAGTGKTRVLVERAIYLASCDGVEVKKIRLVSFTKSVANEIKVRLRDRLGQDAAKVVTTFHRFSRQLLVKCPKSKFRDYGVLDTKGQTLLINKCLNKLIPELSEKAKGVASVINYARSNQECPAQSLEKRFSIDAELWKRLFNRYSSAKRKARKLDFNDILLEAESLLNNKSAAKWAAKRCKFLLVDEAQDLSLSQWNVVNSLIENGTKVFCVGDPAQAIYGFGGAVVEKFNYFESQYDGCRVYHLSENYRSTFNVVNLGNWKRKRINKTYNHIVSNGEIGMKPIICDFADLTSMSDWLAKDLLDKKLKPSELNQVSILIRARSIGKIIKARLDEEGIPVRTKHNKYGVKLLTVHKAKGREWDTCYVIDPRLSGTGWNGMWDRLWNDKQTENCLWYVATTRAKKELTICSFNLRRAAYSDARKIDDYIIDAIPNEFLCYKGN
jgi:DNA helicase-2/ATP-dependent DNA helicase PcrA